MAYRQKVNVVGRNGFDSYSAHLVQTIVRYRWYSMNDYHRPGLLPIFEWLPIEVAAGEELEIEVVQRCGSSAVALVLLDQAANRAIGAAELTHWATGHKENSSPKKRPANRIVR